MIILETVTSLLPMVTPTNVYADVVGTGCWWRSYLAYNYSVTVNPIAQKCIIVALGNTNVEGVSTFHLHVYWHKTHLVGSWLQHTDSKT